MNNDLRKILIISYFYPPSNFVGGDRTASWAKYLHESGYYPIVITRQWNDGQTDLVDKLENNHLQVEYNGTHEVHRLPYKRSLRDRCSAYKWLKPLKKALTLYELITSNFYIRALPYANFYTYSKKLLKANRTITMVTASGRPFQSFAIGHKLKKDFPSIHWIPDYRDEWTTHSFFAENFKNKGLLSKLEKISEAKWTRNASLFVSTADPLVLSISRINSLPGITVYNGSELPENRVKFSKHSISNELNIVYSGTLYSYQNIDLLISAVKSINSANNKVRITVDYIGVNMNKEQLFRLESLIDNDKNFRTHPRVSKNELSTFYSKADVLYLTAYNGNSGWLPVKLFEYLHLDLPILLCPSDHGAIENIIHSTKSGFVADSREECEQILQRMLTLKAGNELLKFSRNKKEIEQYSRSHQAKVLGEALDRLFSQDLVK